MGQGNSQDSGRLVRGGEYCDQRGCQGGLGQCTGSASATAWHLTAQCCILIWVQHPCAAQHMRQESVLEGAGGQALRIVRVLSLHVINDHGLVGLSGQVCMSVVPHLCL
jgi:hypothetical protein